MRLKYMFEEMKKSDATKLQLASEYAGVANYWKFYDGETKQLLKYDVYGQKKKTEDDFAAWAKGKAEYENLFSEYAQAYDAWRPYAMHRMYMNEGINGCRLIQTASGWQKLQTLLMQRDYKPEELKKAVDAADQSRKDYHENYNLKAEENILATAVMMYLTDIDASQQPKGFYENLFKKYSSIDQSPFRAYAADVFANTMMNNDEQWEACKQKPTIDAVMNDPAYQAVISFIKNYSDTILPKYN